jgi:hypothetical protein
MSEYAVPLYVPAGVGSASLLIRRGLDVQTTGTRLGHSTATTTLNLYSHTLQEADRATARILDRALGTPQKRVKQVAASAKMVPMEAVIVLLALVGAVESGDPSPQMEARLEVGDMDSSRLRGRECGVESRHAERG